jgi:phosphoenolpyruvate carboxylase
MTFALLAQWSATSSRNTNLVEGLAPDFALQVIRSFSTYFQMVNTAEKVHRIRRRREYMQEVGHYQPGGFEDTLVKLKASGMDVDIQPNQRDARYSARNRTSSGIWLLF